MYSCGIVWFRNDLRLGDNPALYHACRECTQVIPVFLWESAVPDGWPPGPASQWWLHRSLARLHETLAERGAGLLFRSGDNAGKMLVDLVRETKAEAVYWNRRYEPYATRCDEILEGMLIRAGTTVRTYNASLLVEPWEAATREGKPYRVFTPFWRNCVAKVEPGAPLFAPDHIRMPAGHAGRIELAGLESPELPDESFGAPWQPGEDGARVALERFVEDALADYPEHRDRPDLPGVSRLSPHLRFGEIGVRDVWRTVQAASALDARPGHVRGAEAFLRQLAWREFAYHLLYHYPDTPEAPLLPAFARFPWRKDPGGLAAWRAGRTGYPFVDAAMRELKATGWIQNRARMVAASFLVKHLLVPWQEGAQWFWRTLVDADLANNTLGWQWVAGCGADAAPYFRVFNPVLQGAKFDPDGLYVRRWVPELEGLPSKWIHRPWEAPEHVLGTADVRLGKQYPARIVEHDGARRRALAAYDAMRRP